MTAAAVALVVLVVAAWVAACWPASAPWLLVAVVAASFVCHLREAWARAHPRPR